MDRALAGQRSRPAALSVGVFLEPGCHSPPNSPGVVDQHLFTLCLEDGTNLITPHSPVSPSPETVSIIRSGYHKLILTAIMNIVFRPGGREPVNNEVLTRSSAP